MATNTGETGGEGPVDSVQWSQVDLYRAVVEQMGDVAFVVDEEWRLAYANPRARERTATPAEQLHGTPITALSEALVATDRDKQQFESALETALSVENQQYSERVEVELELPAGRAVFEYKFSPFPAEGDAGGAIIVGREITEQRERERDLELLRNLQSRVLRHNIRNGLNVVRGYAELFAEEFDDEHAAMAESVLATADDILSTSEKTRTIERLIRDDHPTEQVNLAAMLRRIVDTNRTRFPEVRFSLDIPPECRVETVRAVELGLENLIENAAEYSDQSEPAVAVTVRYEDGVVVTVSDNGPGIPKQELTVRDQGSETQLEHGAGAGLWVVEWLTEVSEVAVDYDTAGEGTDVHVRLPCGCESGSVAAREER